MLDAVLCTDLLDEADGALDGPRRVLLEPVREREVEQHLRVGRPFDVRVELGRDLEHQVALDNVEVRDEAVVHPEPVAVAKGVAVRLLHGLPVDARMWAKTSGDSRWRDSWRRLRSVHAGSVP